MKMKSLVIGFVFLAGTSAMAAAPSLTVGSASGSPGKNIEVGVDFQPGSSPVSSLQFDLNLPAGLTYANMVAGPAAASAGKSVQGASTSKGVRVIIFGVNQNALGAGRLVNLTLGIRRTQPPGTLALTLTGLVPAGRDASPVAAKVSNGSVTVRAPAPATIR